MKKRKTGWRMAVAALAACALAGGVFPAQADTATVDGVEWIYDVLGGEATVTGAEPAEGAVAIPSTLGGCPVKAIGYQALYACYNMTSVTIPEGVREIGWDAFAYSDSLESVTIPIGVEVIEGGAFEGCGSLASATIPDSVVRIGWMAFDGCGSMSSISVPHHLENTVSDWGLPSGCAVTVREAGPLAIATGASLPVMLVGCYYDRQVYAIGGTEPYTWSIAGNGSWPEWLNRYGVEGGEGSYVYLSGTPLAGDVGANVFTLRVEDAAGASAERTFTLAVEENPNPAPVIDSREPSAYSFRVDPGTAQTFSVEAHDPKGDELAYAWLVYDAGYNTVHEVEYGDGTAEFTWTFGDTGTYTVQVSVSDGTESTWDDWTVKAAEPEPLEIATPAALATALTDEWYSQALEASGGDEPYTWEIVDEGGWPDWLDRDFILYWSDWGYHCPYLSGRPSEEDIGDYEFTLRVADAAGQSAERTFTLAVEENPNPPPVADSREPSDYAFRVDPGVAQTFSFSAHDPKGDELSYAWHVYDADYDLIHEVEYGDGNTAFTWVFGEPGIYYVEGYVSDGAHSVCAADWRVTAAVPKTVHVDAASTAAKPDGTSWAKAYPTMADAAQAAENGDTVLVAPGVYPAEDDVYFSPGVTLRSRDGAAETILDGGGVRPAIRCTGASDSVVLVGFTIRNGANEWWEPAGAPEGARLENCVITGCKATSSAGIVFGSVLENCAIVGNQSEGRIVAAGCRMWNCTVAGNRCTGYYPAVDWDNSAWNSVIWGNHDESGAEYSATWSLGTDETGESHFDYPAFTNCCVAGFGEDAAWLADQGFDLATLAPGCFGTDPKFVDLANGDVRLREGSPCLDAGDAAWVKGATDLAGNARVQGAAPDLGAYEGGVAGFVVSVRVEGAGTVAPMTALVPAGGSATFTASETAGRPFTGWKKNGASAGTAATYTWKNVRADGTLTATFKAFEFHVDAATGDDENDGLAWETAMASIQAAADAAVDGESVRVKPGTYGAIDTDGKAIRVESAAGAAATAIDGGGTSRCARLGDGAGKGTTLVGFTLRNGDTGTDGKWRDMSGGGAYGGTLWDCVVEGNHAGTEGGGLYCVEAHRCRIVGNSADGATAYHYVAGGGASESDLYNCLVAGNSVSLDLDQFPGETDYASADGGGVAWCDLRQCTVADNAVTVTGDATGIELSVGGGGASYSLDQPGNILYGNTANGEASDSDTQSAASLIGVDPLFVDRANGDYRLREGSPAVDRGWTDVAEWKGAPGAAGDDTDLDGNPRVRGKCVDLGCYESAWTAAEAGTTVVDGEEWWYSVENGSATVAHGPTNGAVSVPATLGGHPVARIGARAFFGAEGVTSVVIPVGVTDIGESAFENCNGLERTTLPSSVAAVGAMAFGYCQNLATLYVPASWEGTDMLERAGVPAGCDIVYVASPVQTVAFLGNGGTPEGQTNAYTVGTAYGELPDAARAGHAFAGWWTAAAGGTQVTAETIVPAEAERTLWAHWTPQTYTVRFNKNGGTGTMAAQVVQREVSTALRANAFKRTGYTFMGWAKSAGGAVAFANKAKVQNLAAANGAATLYAKWAKTKYSVAFNANGGKGTMAKQAMTYGKSAKLRKNAFTRSGYVFLGWAKTKGGAVAYANGGAAKNLRTDGKTQTLYAKWAKKTYAVAFNANGGKGTMAKQSMTYGKAAKLRKNAFKRTGYTFLGWAKTKKGAVAYKDQASVKNLRTDGKTTTLYAKWAKTNYTVAFDANGGSGTMAKQKMVYGKSAKLKKNAFKREGHTFAGWAKTKTGAVAYKDEASVKNLRTDGKTTTLYAVWTQDRAAAKSAKRGGMEEEELLQSDGEESVAERKPQGTSAGSGDAGPVAVTASDGENADAVADGDETTGWAPEGADAGAWVVLSYAKARYVAEVEVVGENLPEGMRVLLSEDAEAWFEGEGGTARYVWVAFPEGSEGVEVREIRIVEPRQFPGDSLRASADGK